MIPARRGAAENLVYKRNCAALVRRRFFPSLAIRRLMPSLSLPPAAEFGSFLAERMGVDRAIRVPQFLISR
jgi:hypothetical protein